MYGETVFHAQHLREICNSHRWIGIHASEAVLAVYVDDLLFIAPQDQKDAPLGGHSVEGFMRRRPILAIAEERIELVDRHLSRMYFCIPEQRTSYVNR